jgi:hypothetical protein
MLSRRFTLPFIAALALVTAACKTEVDPLYPFPVPVPAPSAAALSGTVTLLGDDGPLYPFGIRMELYATRAAYESRTPTVVAPLWRVGGPQRVYRFEFPNLAPGDYYGIACWDFGCGDYRKPGTGELLRITIAPARTTYLHFGV